MHYVSVILNENYKFDERYIETVNHDGIVAIHLKINVNKKVISIIERIFNIHKTIHLHIDKDVSIFNSLKKLKGDFLFKHLKLIIDYNFYNNDIIMDKRMDFFDTVDIEICDGNRHNNVNIIIDLNKCTYLYIIGKDERYPIGIYGFNIIVKNHIHQFILNYVFLNTVKIHNANIFSSYKTHIIQLKINTVSNFYTQYCDIKKVYLNKITEKFFTKMSCFKSYKFLKNTVGEDCRIEFYESSMVYDYSIFKGFKKGKIYVNNFNHGLYDIHKDVRIILTTLDIMLYIYATATNNVSVLITPMSKVFIDYLKSDYNTYSEFNKLVKKDNLVYDYTDEDFARIVNIDEIFTYDD